MDQNDLDRAMNDFVDTLNDLTARMGGVGPALDNTKKSANELGDAHKTLRDAERKAADDKREAEAARAANQASAYASSIAGFKSLGTAMLDTEKSFGKFGAGLNSLGSAVLDISKNFGVLGVAGGLLFKAATMAADAAFKQADNTLKATDSLSKMGAAGSITASQVYDMGHASGLTSKNLEVFTKAASKAGSGISILGNTVGDGMVAFGKITAVTTETRQAFRRLGVSQEELMERQADYIKLQELSGISLSKDQAKVKKESLEYAEQLTRLSILTGKNADKIQADQNVVQLEYEEALAQQMTQRKIDKLKKQGGEENLAAAAKMEKDEKARIAFQKTVTAEFGTTKGLEIARVARTGQIDSKTKGIANLGIDVGEIQEASKKGEEGGAVFSERLKEALGDMKDRFGEAILRSTNSEQFGTSLGGDKEALARAGALSGRNEVQALKDAQAKTEGTAEGAAGSGGAAATDPAIKASNALIESQIELQQTADDLVKSLNPLLSGFTLLTGLSTLLVGLTGFAGLLIALKAATTALGKMAVTAGGGGPDIPDIPDKKGKGKDKPARARDAKGRFVKPSVAGKIAGTAGRLAGTAGRLAGPAAGVIAVGAGAMNAYEGYHDVEDQVNLGQLTKEEGTVKKGEAVGKGAGQAVGGAGGAWAGAAAGAALGSVVPVVGTLIGGLLGAAVGGWLGSKGGEMVGEQVGKSVGKSMVDKPAGSPLQNAEAESSSNISKGLAEMVKQDKEKAKQTNEDTAKLTKESTDTLNKTLLATNSALINLTSSITSMSSGVKGPSAAGGGISVPAGVSASFKTSPQASASASSSSPISSADQLKESGLTIKKGDVQKEGSYIDPKLIEAAKLVQASVPGFMQFTGFNDQFHNENSPTSKHTKGMAFDFVLNKKPSKEEGAKIVSMLSELGIQGIDEYNAPSAKSTGGHIHGGLKAYDGGIFNGPIGGYNVELHGREAIVPLPSPNELVKEGSKEAALPGNASANTENANSIIADLMAMMEEKFDDLIDAIQEGNDTSEELLKVSRV